MTTTLKPSSWTDSGRMVRALTWLSALAVSLTLGSTAVLAGQPPAAETPAAEASTPEPSPSAPPYLELFADAPPAGSTPAGEASYPPKPPDPPWAVPEGPAPPEPGAAETRSPQDPAAEAQALSHDLELLEGSLADLARELEAAQPQLPASPEERERQAFEEMVETGQAPVLARPTGVVYPFGRAVPELLCAPDRACDLELEAGEVVDGLALGASDRWEVTQFFEGEGGELTPHILLKPGDFDLHTNLVVVTNRRTYHVELASIEEADEGQEEPVFHHHLSFWYPEAWAERYRTEAQARAAAPAGPRQAHTRDTPGLDPTELSFAYRTEEPRRSRRQLGWAPRAVFDDGERLYIRLPRNARPLPAVVGVDPAGQPFPLNEQFRDGAFVIPSLVQTVEMVTGSGKTRRWLRIHRLEEER